MKHLNKVTSVLIALLALATAVMAQELKMSTYTTVTSVNVGTSLGVVLPGYIGDIELGGFYEKYNQSFRSLEPGYTGANPISNFKGIYSSFSLTGSNNMDLSLNLRIGVTDQKNTAIIPSLGLERYINSYTGVGVAALLTGSSPSLQVKLTFNPSGSGGRMHRQAEYSARRSYYRALRKRWF